MANNNPSIDPANNDSLAGAIIFSFTKMLQNVNGMLPAKVVSYDRDTNRVQVQLLMDIVGTDGKQYPRPQIASIPVFVFGGGGFRLSFPLNANSLGWVMANDRDISNFLQSYSQSAPNTGRVKQFADGVFFPDAMNGLNSISPADADNAVLQNNSGTVTISISDTGVKITSPSIDFDLGNPLNVMNVNGSIVATGTIIPAP